MIQFVEQWEITYMGEMMILEDKWQVQGTTGKPPWDSDDTYVVGLESECRTISEMMVSTGVWYCATIYPPGSNSIIDEIDPIRTSGPFGCYTTADSDVGWKLTEYDE